MISISRLISFVLLLLCLALLAAGCQRGVPVVPTSTVSPVVESTKTLPVETAALDTSTPTPVPEPAAARVGTEVIALADFEAELGRYSAAGFEVDDAARAYVLEELVNQALLAQAAYQLGYSQDENELQQRLDRLEVQLGGQQTLSDWMAENSYTPETFRSALARSSAAAWMRDRVIDEVPVSAEQVHARQILLFNAEQAEQLLTQLRAGSSFENLAVRYDPVNAGDLGWFPQGYLPSLLVEAAAFGLQPGEVSEVIETELGYHIVKVIERETSRPLAQDARLVLQMKALEEWIRERRRQVDIQLFLP